MKGEEGYQRPGYIRWMTPVSWYITVTKSHHRVGTPPYKRFDLGVNVEILLSGGKIVWSSSPYHVIHTILVT